jgi:hypothetical protein
LSPPHLVTPASPEMPETFLILLAGGIMLAAAISNPNDVTLLWLRLAGIIALALSALSVFFFFRRDEGRSAIQLAWYGAALAMVLGQLAFVQVAWRRTQRVLASGAFLAAVGVGVLIIPRAFRASGVAVDLSVVLAAGGVAAMTGIVLMDMLLGHAYLTASQMTMKPFARLNGALALAAGVRLVVATVGVYVVNRIHPVSMLWAVQGLFMLTRWLVGLGLPFVFIYMAHDCIRRRATQSATGILYVCGILVFIGEMIALPLVRDTGLPF